MALISGALSEMREHFNLSEALEEAVVAAAKIGAVFGTFLGEFSQWVPKHDSLCCSGNLLSHIQVAICREVPQHVDWDTRNTN